MCVCLAARMYDLLAQSMLVTIAGYHRLFSGMLHITWVLIGSKLLVSWTWLLLFGLSASASGLLLATCPTCILDACDIGKSDLTSLTHSNYIGDCKPL